MTPVERQREAQQKTGYGPIWLRRIGDKVVVEVEVPADMPGKVRWVEVIRESIDGNFSHCVEPTGILEEIEWRGGKTPPEPARRKKSQHASREEQHGRYLDCGPANWDDR